MKEYSRDDVIERKKKAIHAINDLIEMNLDSNIKKAKNISDWLIKYARYLNFEDKFQPQKNISYKRGDVIKLELGFNVGSEYGGMHYAIVLDNKNQHNSPVVTVIPLTSKKDSSKAIHPSNVDLGNELYRLLKVKFDTINDTCEAEGNQIETQINAIQSLIDAATAGLEEGNTKFNPSLADIKALLDNLNERADKNTKKIVQLREVGLEIQRMKEGSIAIVNQITTVSKMRIYDPRKTSDVLSGITMSEESMTKINEKVQELYVFKK